MNVRNTGEQEYVFGCSAMYAQPAPASDVYTAEPHLHRINNRIHAIGESLDMITMMLDDHANRLHGHKPEETNQGKAYPDNGGALGEIERNLDLLNMSISALESAARRNIGLA